MRQLYSQATHQPILNQVVEEIKKLATLPVKRWYRGMAHTLHIHFGENQTEIIRSKQGERTHETADYTIFLHGEWEITNQKITISSLSSKTDQIDSFISTHSLGNCISVDIDIGEKIVKLAFSDGAIISVFDRDGAWFVIQKFGQFSYSPQKQGDVEVTEISLEK